MQLSETALSHPVWPISRPSVPTSKLSSRLWGVNIDFIINKHDKRLDKDITYIEKPTYFPSNISTAAYLEYYGF